MLIKLVDDARQVLGAALGKAKKPLLAFSGGKDAIAAAIIAAEFGVRDAVCEESFYFTMQKQDTRALVKQLGLNCSIFDSLTLPWLAKHPEHLFSRDTPMRSRFFTLRQQRTVAKFAEKHGYDAVIFGRRNDTNCVRADHYMARGKLQVFPVRRWREEDVWAFLSQKGIAKPRIYSTAYGDNQNNGPFNIYNAKPTVDECWKDMYGVEPALVIQAAAHIPSAAQAIGR
jgi:3'-phosphoadenosine 5'-phosphosulfate sulfotransferase (PAPS reductase)/FAD synthetase